MRRTVGHPRLSLLVLALLWCFVCIGTRHAATAALATSGDAPTSATTVAAADATLEAEAEAAAQRDADLCTIERVPASSLGSLQFFHRFYGRAPVILTNYTANSGRFRRASSVRALLASYGSEWIEAASGNTYSHTRRTVLFRDYVAAARARPLGLEDAAEHTSYFFGDHDDPNEWRSGEELQRAVEEQQQQQLQQRSCVEADSESNDTTGGPETALCRPAAEAQQPGSEPDPRSGSRPIWAKLLRMYQPPPFVVPQNLLDELAAAAKSESGAGSAAAPSPSSSAVSDVPVDGAPMRHRAPSPDAQRKLFHEAAIQSTEAPTASPTAFPCSSTAAAPPPAPAAEPPLPPRFDFVRYSFGLGGHRSGVPFHFHGAAIAEVLHGAKRWFLFPPATAGAAPATPVSPFTERSLASGDSAAGDSPAPASTGELPFPSFRPELSQLQWLARVYPGLSPSSRPLQCTLLPGELIYIPGLWYHATTNLGFTEHDEGGATGTGTGTDASHVRGSPSEPVSVFISSFVDEPRMEGVMRAAGIDIDAILAARQTGQQP